MPIHPQAQTFLAAIAAQNRPNWDELSPVESREIFRGFAEAFGPGPDMDRVENRSCDGVSVRCFSPDAKAVLPGLIYFHGGGWVLGDLDTHDTLCRRLAQAGHCAVVAVDYRRAPEHKYPAAFDDALTVTNYVASHANELGIDSKRLAVAGDSAGGNLAAAVALRARDVNVPKIQLQILIYPVIEPNFESGSYVEFAMDHGLTRDVMKFFWEQYLDGPLVDADSFANPAKAATLEGVAPAHVITVEYDVLRDEGEAYAQRLQASHVPTTLKRYDGMLHGFLHYAGLFDDALLATEEIGGVIRERLA